MSNDLPFCNMRQSECNIQSNIFKWCYGKGEKFQCSKRHLSMDEYIENTFNRNNNKGNDKNGASNKDKYQNNHYRHIMNVISNERSA